MTVNIELLTAIDKRLMAAGDEQVEKARNEQERARECRAHGEKRVADLADEYAWALRNQADGWWSAAAIVRRMVEDAEA